MCLQKFRNIFYQFNPFGKDIQFKKIDLTTIPTEGGRRGWKPISITWTGDKLEVTWTEEWKSYYASEATPHRDTYTNGVSSSINFDIPYESGIFVVKASGDELFFRCTNVTSLIVNGQVLI